jgi:hypothetical protein
VATSQSPCRTSQTGSRRRPGAAGSASASFGPRRRPARLSRPAACRPPRPERRPAGASRGHGCCRAAWIITRARPRSASTLAVGANQGSDPAGARVPVSRSRTGAAPRGAARARPRGAPLRVCASARRPAGRPSRTVEVRAPTRQRAPPQSTSSRSRTRNGCDWFSMPFGWRRPSSLVSAQRPVERGARSSLYRGRTSSVRRFGQAVSPVLGSTLAAGRCGRCSRPGRWQ